MEKIPNYLQRIPLFFAIFSFAFIAIRILHFGPWWGLMDDPTYLTIANETIPNKGFFSAIFEFAKGDLAWGMFRPTIVPMILLLYSAPELPSLAYILNTLFIFIMVLAISYGYLNSSLTKELRSNKNLTNKFTLLCLCSIGVLGFFAFPWIFFHFLFLSLQEKLVYLGIAVVINIQNTKAYREAPLLKFSLFSALIFAFAFFTKAQIISALPLFLANEWKWGLDDQKDKRTILSRVLITSLICIAGMFFIWWVAQGAPYTRDGYSWQNIQNNLDRPIKPLLILSLAVLAMIVVLAFSKINNLRSFLILAPSFSLIAFVLIMTPWKFEGYILAFSGIYVGLIAIQFFLIFQKFRSHILKITSTTILLIALLIGSARSLYMTDLGIESYGDLRMIIGSRALREIANSGQPLFMGCLEPTDHIAYYATTFAGISRIDTKYSIGAYEQFNLDYNPAYTFWFAGAAWCPIPNPSLQNAEREVIAGGTRGRFSYQLLRIKNPN